MEDNVSSSGMTPKRRVNTKTTVIGRRICPLCASEMRLFFINFYEKLLMCENIDCEFPFGYEELQFVQIATDDDFCDFVSDRSQSRTIAKSSSEKSSGWSEVDRLSRVCQPEDIQAEPNILSILKKKSNKNKYKRTFSIKNKKMQKNVEDLKGLTMELNDVTKTKQVLINNKKWINNLHKLQDQSGINLITPAENKKLTDDIKEPEIKIEIEPGSSGSILSINIEIAKQDDSQTQAHGQS